MPSGCGRPPADPVNWPPFVRKDSRSPWRRTWRLGRRASSWIARCCASGLDYWLDRSDVVLVEGAGGLMSPLADDEYVADLALDFGWPLVVVAPNRIGAINQVLQTLIVAATFREGLTVAGVVLNHPTPPMADPSLESNRSQLERHALAPILGELGFGATGFDPPIDWMGLARGAAPSTTSAPRSEP